MKFGRTIAGLVGSSIAAVGLVGALASPASAVTSCKSTSKEFPTSGFNADVTITLCFYRTYGGSGGGTMYTGVNGTIKWSEAGGGKFENFDVTVRVEQNDSVKKSVTCDITSKISVEGSGTAYCNTGSLVNVSANSGDGKVVYNVNEDGVGNQTWDLAGTPLI